MCTGEAWQVCMDSLANTVVDGSNRGQRIQTQLEVEVATAQVVNNADLVPTGRQVQSCGPSAVAIAT